MAESAEDETVSFLVFCANQTYINDDGTVNRQRLVSSSWA